MSDRLKDLQRQRALAQEQLAWLDREIAREAGQATPPTPNVAPAAVPAVPPASSSAANAHMADEILARYQREADSSPTAVKRGCFLYFGLAFVLLALVVTAWYFYSAARHP